MSEKSAHRESLGKIISKYVAPSKSVTHTLCALALVCKPVLCASTDEPSVALHIFSKEEKSIPDEIMYTVNFNQISCQEFVKFVSRIAKINFVFDPNDLTFDVTIISDVPTSATDIMTMLGQVLSSHNLALIENGETVLIHKGDTIRQIPPLESSGSPMLQTRLFHLQYTNPTRIAALLTPMLSQTAIVAADTFGANLIVTDLSSNIWQAAKLLEKLDSPRGELISYTPEHLSVASFLPIVLQVSSKIFETDQVFFIPDVSANLVFAVVDPKDASMIMSLFQEIDKSHAFSQVKLGTALLPENILIYQLKYKSYDKLKKIIQQMSEGAKQQGFASLNLLSQIQEATPLESIKSIMIIGIPDQLVKVQALLQSIDLPFAKGLGSEKSDYLLYEPSSMDAADVMIALDQILASFKKGEFADPALIDVIESAQLLPSLGAVLFLGDAETMKDVSDLLSSLDRSAKEKSGGQAPIYIIYKIKHGSYDQIREGLDTFAKSVGDRAEELALKRAIEAMSFISQTNSIIFRTENRQVAAQLNTLLPDFDLPSHESIEAATKMPASTEFFMYAPEYFSSEEMLKTIHNLTTRLKDSGLSDSPFLRTLQSAQYDPDLNVILFTGDAKSIAQVKQTINALDKAEIKEIQSTLSYPIENVSPTFLEDALTRYVEDLSSKDPLAKTIHHRKYIPEGNLLVFTGSKATLAQVDSLLRSLDTPGNAAKTAKHFALYPIAGSNGDAVVESLHSIGSDFKKNGSSDPDLVEALVTASYNREQKSVLVFGNQQTIDHVGKMIAQMEMTKKSNNQSVFIFRPKNLSAKQLLENLRQVEKDLESKGSGSSTIVDVLHSAQLTPDGLGLILAVPKEETPAVSSLLESLDMARPSKTIDKVGGSHFLVYKLESIGHEEALAHLKDIAAGTNDSEFKKVVADVRYISSTNSLIFIANDDKTLDKIHDLLAQIDGKPVMQGPALSYKIYTPKHQNGEHLIKQAQELAMNLSQHGVMSQEELKTIENLSVVGSSVLVSGPQQTISSVIDLLTKFDQVSSEIPGGQTGSIEMIDNLSFLIYKVQYHLGSDILVSLKDLVADLEKNPASLPLANAIQSLRWIQVTNSLIATGDTRTLAKLHDLITNIDVPLRQIFIEVLAIETDVEDNLEFGLRWGAQGNFKNRFALSTSNIQPNDIDTGPQFMQNMRALTASSPAVGSTLPLVSGGSFGLIGDIILHGGKTFFALGPLVNALKVEGNITITLNQKIITQDNRTSKIFVGDNIPFTGSIVTTAGLTNTTNANLEYRDIGITLTITPRVGENDIISLDIQEEITQETSTGNDQNTLVSTTQVNGIRTTKTEMDTRVHVPDRCFVILSGSIRDTTTRRRSSIPCLGGLPVIGAAFSQNERFVEKRNVVIFVRPYIIRDYDMYQQLTEDEENLYRNQTEEDGQKDYDRGLNFVKCPTL